VFTIRILIFTILLSTLLTLVSASAQESPEKGISLLETVRITLAYDPNIKLQEMSVEMEKGGLQATRGQFDLKLQSFLTHGRDYLPYTDVNERLYGLSDQETDTLTYRLGLSKQFRSGLSITPALKITQSDNPDDAYRTTNRAEVDFSVELPLLRGRGKGAPGAEEKAAELNYEASMFDLHHTISERILNTITAYWSYLSAKRSLNILKASESRARVLVKEIEVLIKADEVPAADIKQLQANLADKTATRIAVEQTFLEARESLGLAIGLPSEEIVSLPLPSDEFPGVHEQDLLSGAPTSRFLIEQASARRADLLALKKSRESAKIVLEATKHNLKRKLSLIFNIGYAGLEEGQGSEEFFSSLGKNKSEMNTYVAIGGEWPFGNNSARGALLQKESTFQQYVIQTNDLGRNITSGVVVAVADLKSKAEKLMKSEEAALLYRTAVDNEKKKLKLGTSTLIDVITTEDNLTSALLNKISGQLGYANALAQLRFEVGALISSDGEKHSVRVEKLTTIPFGESIKE
jgi:outer membrane protein TolC